MNLKVLLPFQVFADARGVSRIVAETHQGSFGILPRRLDCVLAITPGILAFETEADGDAWLATDGGVLVKAGADVVVSVRRAVRGADLGALRAAVEEDFLTLDAREQAVRAVMSRLESGLLQRFARLHRE